MGGHENLCDSSLFTGYTRDGGIATAAVADARYAFPLGEAGTDVALAPLLCAGLIGWRSLVIAGDGKKLGFYGFGAAAHIVAQVANWQGRSSSPLPAQVMRRVRGSPAILAQSGSAAPMKRRPSRSMPRSSTRPWAISSRWR